MCFELKINFDHFQESRKVRHLSNESSSSGRVTFDKSRKSKCILLENFWKFYHTKGITQISVPNNALRGEEGREEPHTIRERTLRNRRTSLPVATNYFPQRVTSNQPQVSSCWSLGLSFSTYYDICTRLSLECFLAAEKKFGTRSDDVNLWNSRRLFLWSEISERTKIGQLLAISQCNSCI
jgi:hypothetical protein